MIGTGRKDTEHIYIVRAMSEGPVWLYKWFGSKIEAAYTRVLSFGIISMSMNTGTLQYQLLRNCERGENINIKH